MPRAGDSRNPPLLNQIGRIVKKRARTDRDVIEYHRLFLSVRFIREAKTESEAKGWRKKTREWKK